MINALPVFHLFQILPFYEQMPNSNLLTLNLGLVFFTENFTKICLSVLIGGILGAEREFRSKSAGFRTLILICLAATLFTLLSIGLGGKNNPDRIASNILTGIGFLGAGVIFKEENKVMGLTTAITIWVVSSLGMCIGLGYYTLAFQGTGFALLVLYGFSKIQLWMDRFSQVRVYMIRISETLQNENEWEEQIQSCNLKTLDIKHFKDKNERILWWTVKGNQKNQEKWVKFLISDQNVIELNY